MTLSDADFQIYAHGLQEFEAYRIKGALEKCLRECSFMPKLKDIIERMPNKHVSNPSRHGIIVREWEEYFSDQSVVHYWLFEDGDKSVQIRPRKQQ